MVMDVLSPREKDNNTRWIKVGVGFPKGNGEMRILLDAVPLPDKKTGDLVLVVKERTYKDARNRHSNRTAIRRIKNDLWTKWSTTDYHVTRF